MGDVDVATGTLVGVEPAATVRDPARTMGVPAGLGVRWVGRQADKVRRQRNTKGRILLANSIIFLSPRMTARAGAGPPSPGACPWECTVLLRHLIRR